MMQLFRLLLIGSLATVQVARGQIRIVPQERLDSVMNPSIVCSGVIFRSATIEMGSIPEEGGLWTTEVAWSNEREEHPVVITGVKSSCGCLKADFSREPLRRGQTGWLRVTYNPKGRPGAVNQRLFVYTNLSSEKPVAILTLVGHVRASADKRGNYPYGCGALLLRQQQVQLTSPTGEWRIACMNGGGKPLRVTHDRMLGPRGVTVTTDPLLLDPGSEGDLLIRIEEPLTLRSDGTLPLILSGLDLPPRMRTILLVGSDEEPSADKDRQNDNKE